MLDLILVVIGLGISTLIALVAIAWVLAVFLLGGWLIALGLLAYGHPVAAFWTFVAWLIAFLIFRVSVE